MFYFMWKYTFVLISIGQYSYAFDQTCQNLFFLPKDNGTQSDNKSNETTIDSIIATGAIQCTKECKLRRACTTFIFRRQDLECVLLTTGEGESPAKIKVNLGPCENHICTHNEECVSLKSGQPYCRVWGVKEIDLKLVNGTVESEGRVEIYHNGKWGTICARNLWQKTEAEAICKHIGYNYGVPVPNNYFGEGTGIIWFDNLICEPGVTNISMCEHNNWTAGNCQHSSDGGVICSEEMFNEERLPLRLIDGLTPSDGRVQIYFAGHWGSLCFYHFDQKDADVICRQLNYSGGSPNNVPTRSKELIWRSYIDCKGSESFLSECAFHHDWGSSLCHRGGPDRAGVVCTDPDEKPMNEAIRLVDGETPYQGRLEILHAGHWGTICSTAWHTPFAEVACRQLNLTSGFHVSYQVTGRGSNLQVVWMSGIECNGTENFLADCKFGGWGRHRHDACRKHLYDTGVICRDHNDQEIEEGSLRLVNGPKPTEGRIEMYIHGQWTAICKPYIGHEEMLVMCKQLGYIDGVVILDSRYGLGTGKVLIETIQCSGNEERLLDCVISFNNNCARDVPNLGVICTTQNATLDVLEGNIRLVGLDNQAGLEGRLEVYHNHYWGSVCNVGLWDDINAQVVCRQLGFSGGRALHAAFFGVGSDPTWMANVQCDGTEDNLTDCVFDGWGYGTCTHTLDISVVCNTTIDNRTEQYGDIRLMDGEHYYEGRVEIYGPTGYGIVCTAHFNKLDARVICRQLGFNISNAEVVDPSVFGGGSGPIWMMYTHCTGDEARLEYCSFSGWGRIKRGCGQSTAVGVRCP